MYSHFGHAMTVESFFRSKTFPPWAGATGSTA